MTPSKPCLPWAPCEPFSSLGNEFMDDMKIPNKPHIFKHTHTHTLIRHSTFCIGKRGAWFGWQFLVCTVYTHHILSSGSILVLRWHYTQPLSRRLDCDSRTIRQVLMWIILVFWALFFLLLSIFSIKICFLCRRMRFSFLNNLNSIHNNISTTQHKETRKGSTFPP